MRRKFFAIVVFSLSMSLASMLHAESIKPNVTNAKGTPEKSKTFHFTVFGQHAVSEDERLLNSFQHASAVGASFTVLNGIRPAQESCADEVYHRRSKLMAEAEGPVILSLAGSDWATCRNERGQSSAQDRLVFVRELFFEKKLSQHAKQLPMLQQSKTARYRPYSENLRWEVNGILFATVNLPFDNNHYLYAAGRNNEFEDRLVANRRWLQRLFKHAKYHRIKAIVLFADANPMVVPTQGGKRVRRDGFRETRKTLLSLASKFRGKVLLVHGRASAPKIVWTRNFGVLGAGGDNGLKVAVVQGRKLRFSLNRLKPAKVVLQPEAKTSEFPSENP